MKRHSLHNYAGLLATLTLLGILLVSSTVRAEKPYLRFEHLTILDGLTQNSIYSIAQDQDGYMWFATADGLNRYDGYRFTGFRHNPDDTTSLSDNYVRTLFVDRRGQLWIGTYSGGLNRYDRRSGQFVRYQAEFGATRIWSISEGETGRIWLGTDNGLFFVDRFNDELKPYRTGNSLLDALNVQTTSAVLARPNGIVWVGTDGEGLIRINTETGHYQQFLNAPNTTNDLFNNPILSIYLEDEKTLWVGTESGLYRAPLPTEKSPNEPIRFVHYGHDPHDPTSLSHNSVTSIFKDPAGYLWVGTDGGGLNLYEPAHDYFYRYENDPIIRSSLNQDFVISIYASRAGILWVGTKGGGLNKFNHNKVHFTTFLHNPYQPQSLSSSKVWSFFEDSAGRFWVGTDYGLNLFDRENEVFTHFYHNPDDPNSLPNNRIYAIQETKPDIIFVGTDNGLSRFDTKAGVFTTYVHDPNDPNSLSNNKIRSLHVDSDSTLWIGTYGGLNRYQPEQESFEHFQHDPVDPLSLSDNRVWVIYEDLSGDFWIGTSNGLNKFDRDMRVFRDYRSDPDNPYSLSNNNIYCIHDDNAGTLWIGTSGGGLNQFNKASEKFTHYSVEDGLPNTKIYGILEEPNAYVLWLSTNNGLTRFQPTFELFTNFDITDGLQSNEFNFGAYYRTEDGKFYFGGIGGFNSFYPGQIQMQRNQHRPPIVITQFRRVGDVEKTPILPNDHITISYKENLFSFEFAALDYANPAKNMYMYMLEGFDSDWIQSQTRRYVTYTNISGGEYVFRVKGSNNDGVWNESGIKVFITVTSPPWKTWPAYLTYVILILIAVRWYASYRSRVYANQLEARRKAEEMSRARSIQRSMLPRDFPQLPELVVTGDMRTAKAIGGDYYDFILSPDETRLYVAIADVAGKGIPASLRMVALRTILHSLVAQNLSTRDILIRANEQLYQDNSNIQHPGMITMLLMCWDRKTQKVLYTGTGHEYLLVYRQDSGEIERINAAGMWLGIDDNIEGFLQERTLTLNPGDTILLYTDGITEYHNYQGEMFGVERLQQFLTQHGSDSPERIVQNLFKTLDEFSRGMPQQDDMTIVILKNLP